MAGSYLLLLSLVSIIVCDPDPEALPNLRGLAKTMSEKGPGITANLNGLQALMSTLLPTKSAKYYLDKNWLKEVINI